MEASGPKLRLDQAMVARGIVASRSRARDLILRGEVSVDGHATAKPALMVADHQAIACTSQAIGYVSRGTLKLAHAMSTFGLDAKDRVAIDVGASTGGFTDQLLTAGASRVYAVENGHGQLHPRLAVDPHVVSLEKTDARTLTLALIPEPIQIIVADVSFISLTKALPAAMTLAGPDCWLIALVKPQFEAGPGRVPRNGVIRDAHVHDAVLANVGNWLSQQPGWSLLGTTPSPITGGDGNVEFLIGATRHV